MTFKYVLTRRGNFPMYAVFLSSGVGVTVYTVHINVNIFYTTFIQAFFCSCRDFYVFSARRHVCYSA